MREQTTQAPARARRRWLLQLVWATVAFAIVPMVLAAGGGRDGGGQEGPTAGGGVDASVDGSVVLDAEAPDGDFDPSQCKPDANDNVDCTGKCGPVRDRCTGVVKQCGGCEPVTGPDGGIVEQRTCNLATNLCEKPKVTCEDLGAECGTIKNSCGEYLDCPDGTPRAAPRARSAIPTPTRAAIARR